MRSFAVIISLISVALAAPSLFPKADGTAWKSSNPHTYTGQGGCANMTPPFVASISSAHGVTDGYTCFLYPELNCQGTRLVISGQIPDFLDPSINFNDKALSWSCGSVV
ncbi:hypothetical protein K438DRAFT_1986217 [Mycena galopus ATCC 62051]|nr:hypothetical protein K438DRAFT_1986217 [Mycena galopus ATCC 62051]